MPAARKSCGLKTRRFAFFNLTVLKASLHYSRLRGYLGCHLQVRQETSLYLENVAKAKSIAAIQKRKAAKNVDNKREADEPAEV